MNNTSPRHLGMSNSYCSTTPFQVTEKIVQQARVAVLKAAQAIARPDPMYEALVRHVRRYYGEGPVALDVLQTSLSPSWLREGPSASAPASIVQLRGDIMERFQIGMRFADEIDVEPLIRQHTPSVLHGSALVTVGIANNKKVPVFNMHSALCGTGVEFAGRFFGEDESLDSYVNAIAGDYVRLCGAKRPVELHYRANDSTYLVSNKKRILARRLAIFDPHPVDWLPNDYVPSDIYLILDEEEVRLFDRRTNDELTLVLPTAINHSHPDHAPLFAALAGCARRHLVNIDLGSTIMRSGYCPRITFGGNVILRPKTWTMSTADRDVLRGRRLDRGRFFDEWLRERVNAKEYEVVVGDSRLTFSMDDAEAIELASGEVLRNHAVITESFAETHSVLHEGDNISYNHEMIVQFQSNESSLEINIGTNSDKSDIVLDTESILPKWIYYEIFCVSDRIEDILQFRIGKICTELKTRGWIENWFFIRYDEDGSHIRFRVEASQVDMRWRIVEYIDKAMFVLRAEQEIRDWRIRPFTPETIRYRCTGLQQSLRLFCEDSELALLHLQKCRGMAPEDRRTADAVYVIDRALRYLGRFSIGPKFAEQMLKKATTARGEMSDAVQKAANSMVSSWLESRPASEEQGSPAIPESEYLSFVHMAANRAMQNWNAEKERSSLRVLRRSLEIRRYASSAPATGVLI